MKKILFIIFSVLGTSTVLFSQSNIPQLVSFSAEVRDANNQLLVNTNVSLRLTFREGGQTGNLVYCALHQTTTNDNGFLSIQLNRAVLGTGCNGAPSTAFENIPWENGGYWMEVEYQTVPTTPFTNLGQLELASSFYAFAAQTAERISGFDLSNPSDGDIITYNGTTGQWEALPSNNTSSSINIDSISNTGDTLFLSNGQFFTTNNGASSNPCVGVTCGVGETCVNGICVSVSSCSNVCGTYIGVGNGAIQMALTGTDTTFSGISIITTLDSISVNLYNVAVDISSFLGAAPGTLVPEVDGTLSGTTMTITNQTYVYQGIASITIDGVIEFDSTFDNILNSTNLILSGDAVGNISFDGVKQ